MRKILACVATLLLVSACGGGKGNSGAGAPGFDAAGRPLSPYIKLGKPYTVSGRTYYPEHNENYSEEGRASWYGPGFHGARTANGEVFDSNAMTAAHRTLPLPSMVRVTHLKTGKSIVARVNDRGPYSNDRIIDLSHGSAQALGMLGEGIATVRVEYLPEESARYAQLLTEGRSPAQIDAQREVLDPIQLAGASTVNSNATRIDRIEVADAPSPQPVAQPAARPKRESLLERLNPVSSAHAETLPAAGEKYYLALGAFSQQASVDAVHLKFAADGPLDVQQINVNGRQLQRVRLGPISSYQQAQSLLAKAQGYAMPDAKIITVK